MKKGILLFLIPFMFSCSISSRTYKVQFMNENEEIVAELEKSYKAGSKIESPYIYNLAAAKNLLSNEDKIAVKWEMMLKNDDDTYTPSGLFFNPEVDVIGYDLTLKATPEGDGDFAWYISFNDRNGKLLFEKTIPAGQKLVFTDEEMEQLKRGAGSDIFFGEDWKVTNAIDDTKTDFNALAGALTKDTFAVENLKVELQPGDWDVQENFKCFADCTWDEVVNVIHGKTRSGEDTPWASSDTPTGYARLMFDNVNLPQLETSNREGGKNMSEGANVTTPHNCFASGCQKLVHIGKAGTSSADDDDYFVNMIGFDHDVISSTVSGDTAKKAPLTLQMVGALKTAHRFDDKESSVGNGWYTTANELRTTLNNTANGFIPTATDNSSSFKVAMCKKGSANTSERLKGVLSITDDYLWVPDTYEVAGLTGGLGYNSHSDEKNLRYTWYDNSCELNPNASHKFINTTPTNKYFLRVPNVDNAHAPWYSVAWDRGSRKYVANPRGVFEGDRADFEGFKGTDIGSGNACGSNTDGFLMTGHCPMFCTMPVGVSQYEYWARFQTETPVGTADKIPRYKGNMSNYSNDGLYTNKKPSMHKDVHFKKEGGTVAVSGSGISDAWSSRSPQINVVSNDVFSILGRFDHYDKGLNVKVPLSLMFAIE